MSKRSLPIAGPPSKKARKATTTSKPANVPTAHRSTEPTRTTKPTRTTEPTELERQRQRAADRAQREYEDQTRVAAESRAVVAADRAALRRTGQPPYWCGDGSGDLSPIATLGDVLPLLWEVSDSADQTLLENALEDTYDALGILVEAIRGHDDHFGTKHVMLTRFLDRVGRRANLARHVARRIESANTGEES